MTLSIKMKKPFYETIYCCKVVFDVCYRGEKFSGKIQLICRKYNVKTVKMLNKMMRLRGTCMVHSQATYIFHAHFIFFE